MPSLFEVSIDPRSVPQTAFEEYWVARGVLADWRRAGGGGRAGIPFGPGAVETPAARSVDVADSPALLAALLASCLGPGSPARLDFWVMAACQRLALDR